MPGSESTATTTRPLADYNNALTFDPKNVAAYDNLAWLQATCPDEKYRDGKRAIETRTKAYQLDGGQALAMFGTLAAAYAENGDFEKAKEWGKKAVTLTMADKRQIRTGPKLVPAWNSTSKEIPTAKSRRSSSHLLWPRRSGHGQFPLGDRGNKFLPPNGNFLRSLDAQSDFVAVDPNRLLILIRPSITMASFSWRLKTSMIVLLDYSDGSNRRGRRFHHDNMYFGKADLILGQKLGQDRANGLWPP